MALAADWFFVDEPAQASSATVTNAPASAAAMAVDRIQQSVATPVRIKCGFFPVFARKPCRASPHLLKVCIVTTLFFRANGRIARTKSYRRLEGATRAKGNCRK